MTRPLAVRCAICRATHGSTIYRLIQNPRFWINCKPWHPELYETTPEVIDLTQAKVCARCARDLARHSPATVIRKTTQGKLF